MLNYLRVTNNNGDLIWLVVVWNIWIMETHIFSQVVYNFKKLTMVYGRYMGMGQNLWLVGGLEHDLSLSHHIGNGMSSSQLTKSIIFQRGRYTTNQMITVFFYTTLE